MYFKFAMDIQSSKYIFKNLEYVFNPIPHVLHMRGSFDAPL